LSHPDIHIGRDGWLFLTGGTNRLLGQYRDTPLTRWRLWRWKRLIERRHARARRLGVRFLQTVIPEKLTVYDDRLDGLAVDVALSPARRLGAALTPFDAGGPWLDLVGPFRRGRDAAQLYHRTDTHWTFAGCHLAYREICRMLGLPAREDFEQRPFNQAELAGDLGAKLDPPRTELMRNAELDRDSRQVRTNALADALIRRTPIGHSGAHAVFENAGPGAAPLRVLLFGDSYAHVVPFMLTGMLAETVRELDFVWSASVDWGYVERSRPDILICLIAERFTARVPKDRFRLVEAGEPDDHTAR
jgi:alginate O-acetyltransferase complex protein AlgJ